MFDLEAAYTGRDADPPFSELIERCKPRDEAALAELIEADGRERIRRGRAVGLDRYLQAIANLREKADALDAAIDMALRWIAQSGKPDPETIQRLTEAHPEFADEIREAAALSNAIWSTTQVRTSVLAKTARRTLPSDFGPRMVNGVPRYELLELLGEGAFGQVYRAVDRQLSEDDHAALVAVKILAGGDGSDWSRRLAMEEATKARRVEHPCVVRVIDRGATSQDEEFIVYEYVDGGDLGRWVLRREQSIDVREAARLLTDIARGVHAAHMAGLVHCDIKPGNIMMTNENEAKVADFGIAIRASEVATGGRSASAPQGNMAFISPEQFRGDEGSLTVPSDIYALGGILYWLLANQLPNGSSVDEIDRLHATRTEAPSPRSRRPEIGEDLDAICRRAMAIDPGERYASAAALADDLETWSQHRPLAWRQPSPLHRLRLFVCRKPGLAAAMFAIMVLVVTGFVFLQRAIIAERANDQARGIVHGFAVQLKKARGDGIGADLMSHLWALEWIFGPTVTGDANHIAEVWGERINAIEVELGILEDRDQRDSVLAMIWQEALALWLIRRAGPDDLDRADQLLADWHERFATGVDAADDWFRIVRALETALAAAREISEPTLPTDGLHALVHDLEAEDAVLAEIAPRSSVRLMILDHLVALHGDGFLDLPERADELKQLREDAPNVLNRESSDEPPS